MVQVIDLLEAPVHSASFDPTGKRIAVYEASRSLAFFSKRNGPQDQFYFESKASKSQWTETTSQQKSFNLFVAESFVDR